MSKISHYSLGKNTFRHKGKLTTTSTGLDRTDNIIANLENLYDYDVGYVPMGYEHRPDLISDIFYNTPEYWWLILLFNNITDPFESLKVGERILIPKI